METDTSCLPLLGRSVDVLSNALVEFGRCGGHRHSHRDSKKKSGEVDHDVKVSYKERTSFFSEHSSGSGKEGLDGRGKNEFGYVKYQ